MLDTLTLPVIVCWLIVTGISGILCGCLYSGGRLTKDKAIAIFCLVFYLFFVFTITLSGRIPGNEYAYKLKPLWSWRFIIRGETKLIFENMWNIVMFVPIGVLFSFITSRKRMAVFLAFVLSLCIELIQLFSMRGLFEFDDMFHNTLGAVIGCLVYMLLRKRKRDNG